MWWNANTAERKISKKLATKFSKPAISLTLTHPYTARYMELNIDLCVLPDVHRRLISIYFTKSIWHTTFWSDSTERSHLIHLVIGGAHCATKLTKCVDTHNGRDLEWDRERMDEKSLISFNKVILPFSNWIRKQQTKSYFMLQRIYTSKLENNQRFRARTRARTTDGIVSLWQI